MAVGWQPVYPMENLGVVSIGFLLSNPQVAVISTRLTARQLLDRDGSEIMGARRLQSVWTVNVGFFYVKIVPGLTLTSFSTQVCHGVPPSRSSWLFRTGEFSHRCELDNRPVDRWDTSS